MNIFLVHRVPIFKFRWTLHATGWLHSAAWLLHGFINRSRALAFPSKNGPWSICRYWAHYRRKNSTNGSSKLCRRFYWESALFKTHFGWGEQAAGHCNWNAKWSKNYFCRWAHFWVGLFYGRRGDQNTETISGKWCNYNYYYSSGNLSESNNRLL